MNSNLFHNISNVVSLLLAVAACVLLWSGCIVTPAGSFDCAGSFIDPGYTAIAIAVIQLVKMIVNVVRDGIAGLAKPQPPVKQ
jgi:hypothetical protein